MFFDGGCPLCRREVSHYRRLDRNCRVDWVDIQQDMRLLSAFGVSYPRAMQRLHALTADGLLVDGAYAFAAVWSELPYYRWLARLLYATRTLPLLDGWYGRFARWRYRRRCRQGSCAVESAPQNTNAGPRPVAVNNFFEET